MGGCKDGLSLNPLSATGTDLIATQRGQHIPGTHLSAVLVAAEAVGLASIEFVEYLVHILLRLLRLAEDGVEPGGMVARLVAVGVHTDEACNVGLLATTHSILSLEEAVEEGKSILLATEMFDPGVNVVRHIGAILPAVGLGEVVVDLCGVEGRHPAAVALGMGEAVGVDDILPALAANPVGASRGRVAGNLGHLGNAPVVVGIFEGLAHALIVQLRREVALRGVGAVGLGAVAGGHHGVEQLLRRVARQCAVLLVQVVVGLKHHRHCVITNHAVRLMAGQLPHGQFAALLPVLHGGIDEVHRALRLNLRQERVQRAVGVPQREHSVHFSTLIGHMYLSVGAAVASVLVTPQVGRGHAVVKCRIEATLLLFAAAIHL